MSNSISPIGVVILNYTTYQNTIRLVEELQQQTVIEQMRIVVVDNCSPNDSYERLKPLQDRFDNVVVIRTSENLGYAKGNNFGLRYLDENNPPQYVVILNNDVSLEPDCLRRLAARYEELDNAGVIAPLMVDERGDQQAMMNGLPSFWDDFKSLFILFQKLRCPIRQSLKDDTGFNAMSVDVIGGSFMFSDRERFSKMGYFYPNTFLYVEERFVAEAAKREGYKNYLILDQTYQHAHNSPSISAAYNQVSRYKMLYRSRREYIRVYKRYGKLMAVVITPFMWWSILEWRVIGWVRRIL